MRTQAHGRSRVRGADNELRCLLTEVMAAQGIVVHCWESESWWGGGVSRSKAGWSETQRLFLHSSRPVTGRAWEKEAIIRKVVIFSVDLGDRNS